MTHYFKKKKKNDKCVKMQYLKKNETDIIKETKTLIVTYKIQKYTNIGQFIFKFLPETKKIVQNNAGGTFNF